MMESLSGILGGSGSMSTYGLQEASLGLLLAFILGQLAAWLYIYTHEGLSYSRAFVQSIVLLTFILCLGMMVIGNNIAIAFGLIGALAVIRFRNILKDTRDTSYIFFTLITGLATGTQRFQLALLGAVVFCAVALYLHWAQCGSRKTGDGYIRFRLE
jgi:NhaP-type Na+/H+ or K+/H+ antiporter